MKTLLSMILVSAILFAGGGPRGYWKLVRPSEGTCAYAIEVATKTANGWQWQTIKAPAGWCWIWVSR